MRVGSLFSGTGGLEMAVNAFYGSTTAWVSDIDPGACKILAHRYPDVPNLGDITTVDWADVEPVDILTGGFPCQDLSHAGKRAGMTGARSGLWSVMAEAINQLRPQTVVIENVRGILSASAASDLEPCPWCMGDGTSEHALRALGCVLGDLADLGYDAQWHGLRAADVGAPHGRFRIFITAHPGGETVRLGTGLRKGASQRIWRGRPDDVSAAHLLPTPTRRDHKGHNQRWDDGCLTGALMPTPSAADGLGGHERRGGDRGAELLLAGAVKALLPTPRATDGTNGGPNQRGSSGDLMLPSAVHQLLPTPAVNDMGEGKTVERWDEWTAAQKAKHGNGNGHGPSLAIEAQRLLPTTQWGNYAAAIARWESVTRAAPDPTVKGRLNPVFVEWMMGLPEGWVTDVGLTRNQQLKALGNGVVPQQAYAALQILDQLRAAA